MPDAVFTFAVKTEMKRLAVLLFFIVMACAVCGQNEKTEPQTVGGEQYDEKTVLPEKHESGHTVSDSLALGEVVVRGSRIVSRPDELRIFPTGNQKERSSTAYGLLAKLSLPFVTVDEVTRTITVPGNMGQVQIRINDVVARSQDLLSLDMESVRYVDFIRNPGVRYGEGVDFVINIVARRAVSGYAAGLNLMNTVTCLRGQDNIYARFNHGRSELAVDYSFGFSDAKRLRYEETADYLMPDNSVRSIHRADMDSRQRTFGHELQLRYSYADSDRSILQMTLSGSWQRSPDCMTRRMTTVDGGGGEIVPISSSDRSVSPVLDVYYNSKITDKQTVTANITGSYTGSDYSWLYGSASPYGYTSEGKSRALSGECVYENRLRPFTLSSGIRYDRKYVSNRYEGGADANNSIHNSNIYVFAQIKGRLSALSYTLGMGISRQYYRQAAQTYDYWLWRPEISLSYSLSRLLRLKYNLTVYQHPPRLEYLGDVAVQSNELEISAGNASLYPARVVEQSFALSCQLPSFYAEIETYYRSNIHCVMPRTDRVTDALGDTRFVFTRSNQRRISLFYVNGYTRVDMLEDKLSLTATGGLFRCFNYGDEYKHHYSAFNGRAMATAYLNRLTLSADVSNGWSFLEGENKVSPSLSYGISASYKFRDFDVSLHWQNCFRGDVRMHRAELLNRYVHKVMTMTSGDMGNMVSLNVSWRLSKGRKYDGAQRKQVRHDTDTGVRKSGMTAF